MARTTKSDKVEKNETPSAEVNEEAAATDAKAEESAPSNESIAESQQQVITVNDSEIVAGYSNFCRVSSTPEELILDLGLNPNPYAPGNTTVNVSQRIIMNHYTAKRMLQALSVALQRHEQAFGVLETDIQKRIRPSAQPARPQ